MAAGSIQEVCHEVLSRSLTTCGVLQISLWYENPTVIIEDCRRGWGISNEVRTKMFRPTLSFFRSAVESFLKLHLSQTRKSKLWKLYATPKGACARNYFRRAERFVELRDKYVECASKVFLVGDLLQTWHWRTLMGVCLLEICVSQPTEFHYKLLRTNQF